MPRGHLCLERERGGCGRNLRGACRIARLPCGLLQSTEVQTECCHLTPSQDIPSSGDFSRAFAVTREAAAEAGLANLTTTYVN